MTYDYPNHQLYYLHCNQSEPCQCHDCTQARWKQSFQYQFEQAQAAVRPTTDGVDPFNGPELEK